jgi:threonyl-tRNA synthetase
MVHRALLGSLERFFGVLVEHYAGAFPLWLTPVQAVVIPVSARQADYAARIAGDLRENGLRVVVDDRNEKMGYRIREAQLQKVPYMLVVGDREREAGNVSVRHRRVGDMGPMDPEDLLRRISQNVSARVVQEESMASIGGVS